MGSADDVDAGVRNTNGLGLDGVVQLPFRQPTIEPLAAGDQAELAPHQSQGSVNGSGRPLEPERITHKVCR